MRHWRSVAGTGTVTPMVVEPQSLESLSAEQLRSALLSMLEAAAAKDQELAFEQPPSTSSPTRTRCSSA
jgi:hypothetical protein